MILTHDRVVAPGGDPGRWMVVLHGIYGAGRNWGSVARRFVRARPEWGMLMLDLRLHGGSRGFEPPHTLEACADDVKRLVAHVGLPADAVLGHSFGGKVALLYLRDASAERRSVAPVPTPALTWLVESTPAPRPPEGSAWAMLDVLHGSPGPFTDRAAGIAAVEAKGFPTPVAEWMATNLVRAAERGGRAVATGPAAEDALPGSAHELVWRLDANDMEAFLRDFFRTDAWPVLENPPEGSQVHVVKARESSVLDEASCERVEKAGPATGGRVLLHHVDGGHWVNADDSEGLHRLLMEYMP